jgi:5-methyltetrahydropteroyltriglutamate--homocysteine methyltransferase
MQRSTERILTTHAGSLHRPDDLLQLWQDQREGRPVEDGAIAERVRRAVAEAVEQQRQVGVDVVSDGEMSKSGFTTYLRDRFDGFGGTRAASIAKDLLDYPELEGARRTISGHQTFSCVAPITVRDAQAVHRDIANLKAVLGPLRPDQAFICAPSPGQITFQYPNHYYPSHQAYLEGAAEALRYEYQAIVEAGFNLQVDSPDLAMAAQFRIEGTDLGDFRTHSEQAIEVLNHALRDLPPDSLRLHVCWGNYYGPHHHDVPLEEIVHTLLKARPTFIYPEAANPRHEHEWEVWREVKLPAEKALIVGVIDVHNTRLEHPRLVAQRIRRYADVVGRENVLVGTDCGFSTFAGSGKGVPRLAWAKLQAMVDGARLASRELW